MTLGVILKGFNYLRANKRVDFWFEFLPQLIMLLALFGFMDYLIIVKWLTDYSLVNEKPPSIITTMISMVLGFGESDPRVREAPLIDNQTLVMRIMLITAILCAPIMLLVKPLHERKMM